MNTETTQEDCLTRPDPAGGRRLVAVGRVERRGVRFLPGAGYWIRVQSVSGLDGGWHPDTGQRVDDRSSRSEGNPAGLMGDRDRPRYVPSSRHGLRRPWLPRRCSGLHPGRSLRHHWLRLRHLLVREQAIPFSPYRDYRPLRKRLVCCVLGLAVGLAGLALLMGWRWAGQ